VLLQGSTRILIYIGSSFSRTKLCPSCCYLTFFHIPERSIALVKRLAGSPKGAEIDPNLPHANKVFQGSTRIPLMDFFQSHQTVPKPLLSYLLPYSRTFNCTSKRLAGSPKELKLIPTCPTLTKVLPKVAHAFLYTLMDFCHQTVPKLLSYLLPYSERSIALVNDWLVHQKAEIDPNLPHANKVLPKVAHAFLYT
jgi:hypothetical protein